MQHFTEAKPGHSPAVQFPPANAQISILPNGLGVIVQEDHSSPVASVQVWVETGSIHEGAHAGSGISHMLEHMLFKGTESMTCSQFAQRIQDSGGYVNAYTSFDRTVYWIDIPSKGALTAIELLSDAVLNSTLPADEFTKEQEVIRREFAMGFDDPDRVSSVELFATAYTEHPYRHPVIGHLDVFNALTRDTVMGYYKERYVPNNMFFVVAGDVEPAAVVRKLEALFAGAPRKALAPVYVPSEPPQLGRRESHREFETELTRLHLAWHTPPLAHSDVPALDVLSVILGHGRSSQLYRQLREETGIVHSVDAWCYAPGQAGLFGVDAMLDPEHLRRVQEEALRVLEKVRAEGVSSAELEKAKRQSLSHQLQSVTTMRGKASDLGSNWLLARNLDFSRDYLAAVQRVTADDFPRVIDRWLTEKNLTAVSLSPTGSLHREGKAAVAHGAGEIQKFELSNGLRLLREIQKFELSNGLRLLVREDPRLPLVSISAGFKGGLLAETPENNGITKLLSRVLLKGTRTRTSDQLADEIEAVGGAISAEAGNNSLTVHVRVMQPDLALGMELLGDVLCNATLPEKAITREKEVQLASIKAEEEEVTVVARNVLRRAIFGTHPYGMRGLGEPQSVSRLDQGALAAYRDQHIVAKNGVVAIFGNVNAAEVVKLAEQTLAKLPPGQPAFLHPPQPCFPECARELVEVRNKAQAVLMVGFPGGDLFSEDRAALEVIDEASSDLGSRFFVRIREEMGLAYFVGSSNLMGLAPGPFVFYLGTDPQKLTAVQAELMSEILALASNGLSAVELARAKEKLIGQQDIRNQSNDAFAFMAALDELYGLGFDNYKELRKSVSELTVEDVKRVCAKYFLSRPATTAIVRPEA